MLSKAPLYTAVKKWDGFHAECNKREPREVCEVLQETAQCGKGEKK